MKFQDTLKALERSKITDLSEESRLKGVSVQYLQNVLLKEVRNAGLNVNTATVCDMENLKSTQMGVIRRKGANIICPRDGDIGAAYVDSIQDPKAVGRANVMLSYSWGYKIKDIVESLAAQCEKDKRDPEDTYVWICCLCNNQHRISKVTVEFDDFGDTFYNTVTSIGTVWSLMAPWNNPQYLKRVWCVFEIYVANTDDGVTSEIIMPEEQREAMVGSLDEINNVFEALSNTRIENADASQPEDKENILKLVKETIGLENLNQKINELLREWIVSTLEDVIASEKDKSSTDHATLLFRIARVLRELGNHDGSLNLLKQCLVIQEKVLGMDHQDTANTYNDIGLVLDYKGEWEAALDMYKKCLAIYEKVLGEDHPDTATTYSNIGSVLQDKGEWKSALDMYKKCLAIQEKVLGKDHPSTATTYNNIGSVLQAKGECDAALDMYKKCLAIEEKVYGKDHPSTATTYGNIGLVLKAKGEWEDALDMYKKCLAIQEKVLGEDHPLTATTYYNIGSLFEAQDEYDAALDMYKKCLAIQEKKVYGKDHGETNTTRNKVENLLSLRK